MHEFSARVYVLKEVCNVTWKGFSLPFCYAYLLVTFFGSRIIDFRIQYHLQRFWILPAEQGIHEDSCSIIIFPALYSSKHQNNLNQSVHERCFKNFSCCSIFT